MAGWLELLKPFRDCHSEGLLEHILQNAIIMDELLTGNSR